LSYNGLKIKGKEKISRYYDISFTRKGMGQIALGRDWFSPAVGGARCHLGWKETRGRGGYWGSVGFSSVAGDGKDNYVC